MDIAWYGHAAFRLRGRGANVVTDPCAPQSGFRLNRPSADIVTVSRPQDALHNYVDGVAAESDWLGRPLDAPGEYELKRVLVTGVRTPGAADGWNTAFVITIDEIIFAHLGDLRAMPSRQALEELQRAQVCLLPIGGGAHLSPEAAASVAGELAIPLIIPMMYQPEAGENGDPDALPQTGLERLAPFASAMGLEAAAPKDNHVSLTPSSLPQTPTIMPLLARGA